MNDEASVGDIAFALTMFFMLQGYLRDVGMHIRNLQRSVNDMEELVALERQPLGIDDRPDAPAIRIGQGEIRFEHVTFRYGNHPVPLYDDFDAHRAGRARGLVGHSGSGKTTFIKLIQRLYDVSGGRITIDGTSRRSGRIRCAARSRSSSRRAVPPHARGEHRVCASRREPGRHRARRAARQRARLHRHAAGRL